MACLSCPGGVKDCLACLLVVKACLDAAVRLLLLPPPLPSPLWLLLLLRLLLPSPWSVLLLLPRGMQKGRGRHKTKHVDELRDTRSVRQEGQKATMVAGREEGKRERGGGRSRPAWRVQGG